MYIYICIYIYIYVCIHVIWQHFEDADQSPNWVDFSCIKVAYWNALGHWVTWRKEYWTCSRQVENSITVQWVYNWYCFFNFQRSTLIGS